MKPQKKQRLQLILLVAVAVAVSYFMFVKGPRATNAALTAGMVHVPQPALSPSVRPDAGTLAAASKGLPASVTAAQLRAFVLSSATKTGVKVRVISPRTGPGAAVTAAGSVRADIAFLAALSANVTFTSASQLRATGTLWLLSGVVIGVGNTTRAAPATGQVPVSLIISAPRH